MKMKEVLERTGLTDRAVRLYIANELAAPECTRSYTGRNNYDFSEADVEALQKIALLRKADFSIEQIKALQLGGEEARKALTEYLEEKREEYQRDGLILKALADLTGEETLSLDEICRRLTEGFRKKEEEQTGKVVFERKLPLSDLKPTLGERLENMFFLGMSGLFILFYALINLFIIIYLRCEFVFPKLYSWKDSFSTWIAHVILLVPIGLGLWVFIKHLKVRWTLETRELRKKSALILVACLVITIFAMPFSFVIVGTFPVVYSQTENPDNYLVVSKITDILPQNLYEVFPIRIPYSAYERYPYLYSENTEYFFRYRGDLKTDWDIYAEWELPEAEFQREIQRVRRNLQEGTLYEQTIGEWICLSSEVWELTDYSEWWFGHIFFAYHQETNRVRYIYCMSGRTDSEPYFLSLDWES